MPIKNCFEINGKQRLYPKNSESVRFKSYGKIVVTFVIDTDFESILVPKGNGKQNPNES